MIADQSDTSYGSNDPGPFQQQQQSPPLIQLQNTSELGILNFGYGGAGIGIQQTGISGSNVEYSGVPGDIYQPNVPLEMIPQEFPMDDVSVFDFTRTGWVMADGSSFAEQPFAVEVGDQAIQPNTMTFDFANLFSATDQEDNGDRELFELISMDFGL